MLTHQECLDEILAICDEMPDVRNPRDGSQCLYYKEDHADDQAKNCLIGKFFVNRGVDVTRWPARAINYLGSQFVPAEYSHLFRLLGFAQNHADGNKTWGETALYLRNNLPYIKENLFPKETLFNA